MISIACNTLRKILLLSFLFLCSFLFANIEDLEEEFTNADRITRVQIANKITKRYLSIDLDKAETWALKSLNLAKKEGLRKEEVEALRNHGSAHYLNSDYENARKYYLESIKVAELIDDVVGIAKAYNNISNVYKKQNRLKKAIEYAEKALTLKKKYSDNNSIGASFTTLGLLFLQIHDYDQTLHYFNLALKKFNKSEEIDAYSLAKLYNNFALVYENLELGSEAIKYYQKAIEFFEKEEMTIEIGLIKNNIGLMFLEQNKAKESYKITLEAHKIFKELGFVDGLRLTYINLGKAKGTLGKHNVAIKYYDKALEFELASDNDNGIGVAYFNLSESYYYLNEFETAITLSEKALTYANKVSNPHLRTDTYALLTNCWLNKNDYKLAYKYLEKYAILRDSIVTKKFENETASYATQFDTEDKKNKIKELKKSQKSKDKTIQKQKDMMFAGIIILVLLLVLIIIIYTFSHFRKRMMNKLTKEKQKSDKLLLNILPADIAEELKENGKAEPREFKNVTVMFIDLVDFTKISSTLTPNQLLSELNDIFTSFDAIMEKYNCERIKTIGDAFLAVSGMPKAQPNSSENIVNAAKECLEYINKRKGSIHWKIRIGIHRGSVIGGIVGSKKYIYDVFGDVLNIAFRIQQISTEMQITISEEIYDDLKNTQNTFEEKVILKGKGEMLVYHLD